MYNFKFSFLLLILFYHSAVFAVVGFKINGVEKDALNNITVFLQGLSEPKNADNETLEHLRILSKAKISNLVSVENDNGLGSKWHHELLEAIDIIKGL